MREFDTRPTDFDIWLQDGLANATEEQAAEDRSRIGELFGFEIEDAEAYRMRLLTDRLAQKAYYGAVWNAAALENEQYDKETVDEKTRILNEKGLRRWVTRQFQIAPDEEGDRRLSNVETRESRAAVLFGDLCNFKLINDVFGHSNADELLREAAKRLPQQIRFRQVEPHAVARIHGDEYVAVVQGIDADDAQLMLERLQAVQLEKLASPEAQLFWSRLRKVAAEEEQHEALLIKGQDADGLEETYLKLGDIQITADQAAVVSLGMSYGAIKSPLDLKNMKDAADDTQSASKEAIHEAMGGAYRSHEATDFQAVPVSAHRFALGGLKAWAMRHRRHGKN